MDQDEILLDAEDRMQKAIGIFQSALQGLRTGRATPGLVDSIRVDYYGSPTPLKQLASISVPEPQQIMIRPFDAGALGEIARAIQSSGIGLSPNNDGRLIRLNVPPLSTERRRQLVARVRELAEEARVSIRNIRRDANKHADVSQKDKILTEDERDKTKAAIQELTKKSEQKVNDSSAGREREIMEE